MAMVARMTLWGPWPAARPAATGPVDAGLWSAVVERINPAKARPRLRPGIEEASLVSARGVPYDVALAGPGGLLPATDPQEWALAGLMVEQRTGPAWRSSRISGRLAQNRSAGWWPTCRQPDAGRTTGGRSGR